MPEISGACSVFAKVIVTHCCVVSLRYGKHKLSGLNSNGTCICRLKSD